MFNVVRRVRGLLPLALCVALWGWMATGAFASVTLPTTGVDIPGTVTAMVTYLGAAILAIFLAFAAFRAIKVAMRWFGKIGG